MSNSKETNWAQLADDAEHLLKKIELQTHLKNAKYGTKNERKRARKKLKKKNWK